MSPRLPQQRPPALIGRSAMPSENGPKESQRRSLFRILGSLIGICRDYSADDIGRLKEAGVRRVEGMVERDLAQTRNLLADAELRFAQAEVERAKAEQFYASAEKQRAETRAIESQTQSRIDAAAQVLKDAISRMRQQGGSVAFDEKQLTRLLEIAQSEYRGDDVIADAGAEFLDDGTDGQDSE